MSTSSSNSINDTVTTDDGGEKPSETDLRMVLAVNGNQEQLDLVLDDILSVENNIDFYEFAGSYCALNNPKMSG